MSKNPVVPYILIFALGLGLIFFMSLYGLDQKDQIANQGEEGNTEENVAADFDAESLIQGKCIMCHGGNLEGVGATPGLVGTSLSEEQLKDIIQNGVPGTMMPGGLVPAENLDELVEYILTLK